MTDFDYFYGKFIEILVAIGATAVVVLLVRLAILAWYLKACVQ